MQPFTRLTATACPLPLASVDTDQLIPARFMKRSRAEGYGGHLLYDLRFDADGRPRTGFPLNDPRWAGAQILVARRNFGAGSSREAAVYALVDFGIRCVVAPSFGDIFASNAVNNGLLPARVGEADAEALLFALRDGRRGRHRIASASSARAPARVRSGSYGARSRSGVCPNASAPETREPDDEQADLRQGCCPAEGHHRAARGKPQSLFVAARPS